MVECNNDYHQQHYNACMYEDYENEDGGSSSLMGNSRQSGVSKSYSSSPGLSLSASERNRRNMNEQPSSTTLPNKQKNGKSSYKHVPHREKPPHLVERRNARERRRVEAVNNAFARLRKCVPLENR